MKKAFRHKRAEFDKGKGTEPDAYHINNKNEARAFCRKSVI